MSEVKHTMTAEEEVRWVDEMKRANPRGRSLRDLCTCAHMRMLHEYGRCSRYHCRCREFEPTS